MNQNIDIKLNYWKKSLLDSRDFNSLINCPLPSESGQQGQGRQTLLIKNPNASVLWHTLVENNNQLTFPKPTINKKGKKTDATIQTNQSGNEMDKTLHALKNKSHEFDLEKGINVLYLAFGFLNWRVKEGTNVQVFKTEGEMRSPLLLVPVQLRQEAVSSPFVLVRGHGEIVTNRYLEEALRKDFKIELPTFNKEVTLEEYLVSVRKAIKSNKWEITNDLAQLSLFLLETVNMYYDLEQNTDIISNHPIVTAISGQYVDDETVHTYDMGDGDFDHDTIDPEEVFSIVDADSDQQEAIRYAKAGKSFVLQGAPGTGKSQTITNIIAELLATNKKVLFVAEKKVALETVNNRLKSASLDPFCLTVHSHTSRRDILDQFNVPLDLLRDETVVRQDALEDLRKLKTVRQNLNQYTNDLHTPIAPLGLTIYQIQGYIAKYGKYPDIDYIQKDAHKLTRELLTRRLDALLELTRIVKEDGYQIDNPWQGYASNAYITQEFVGRFNAFAESLLSQINEGYILFSQTSEILGADNNWSYASIDDIDQLYHLSLKCREIPTYWLSLDLDEIVKLLKNCIRMQRLMTRYQSSKLIWIETKKKLDVIKKDYDVIAVKKKNIINELLSEVIDERDSSTLLSSLTALIDMNAQSLKETYDTANEEYVAIEAKYNFNLQHEIGELRKKYDESVLSIDALELRNLYRTEYRSKFKRGQGFKQAQNKLKAHQKAGSRLSYDKALFDLERIINIQIISEVANRAEDAKKAYYDYQQKSFDLQQIIPKVEEEEQLMLEISKEHQEALYEYEKSEKQMLQLEANFNFDEALLALNKKLKTKFDKTSEFDSWKVKAEWANGFQKLASKLQLGDIYKLLAVPDENEITIKLEENLAELTKWRDQTKADFEKYANLFNIEHKKKLYNLPLKPFNELLASRKEAISSLEHLIDYYNVEERIAKLGLASYLAKVKEMNMEAEEIIPVYEKCFYRSLLDLTLPKFDAVREFRRRRQEERLELFRTLDKEHLQISKEMLLARLVEPLPDILYEGQEITLLRHEMSKQQNLLPSRSLLAKLSNILPALKPCIMTSPLAVSTILGASNYEFDTVIFDEASQIRTEDAIGAIFRAKQVIIVGDSNQLPPPNLFREYDTSEESEAKLPNDLEVGESLIADARFLPTLTLNCHYHSHHEDLIAFSNENIYDKNLVTFPAPSAEGVGVEYIHVPSGVYECGDKGGNLIEAEKVVGMIFEHFEQYENKRTLGVIAFDEMQQQTIYDVLLRKRKAMPKYEKFFQEKKIEHFFIKRVAIAQGHQRDTIICSIGFTPDGAGKFQIDSDSLKRIGEKRLVNVAATRARYNLKLVGTIMPDTTFKKAGDTEFKFLKQYIDFAVNGKCDEVRKDDSPFEDSVYELLTSFDYNVKRNVGCWGYQIDLAVEHPDGNYVIGIECDGFTYHSAETATERDRLRTEVLEEMGWTLYRIWSTDWVKDPYSERKRLIEAVDKALENYEENRVFVPEVAIEVEDSKVFDTIAKAVQLDLPIPPEDPMPVKDSVLQLKSEFYRESINDIPFADIVTTMGRIAKTSDMTKVELFKETALSGYGWKRQGVRIRAVFEQAYEQLSRDG